MSFIRFQSKNYILEDQLTCLPENGEEYISDGLDSFLEDDGGNSIIVSVDNTKPCPEDNETYAIPAKPGDEFSWIVDKSEFDNKGADVSVLRIGLVNCGVLVAANIGTIVESENQYAITVVIPQNTLDCTYNFVIYNIINPIDCSMFAHATGTTMLAYSGAQIQGCLALNFI